MGTRWFWHAMKAQYNILCNCKPGDKVRYKRRNDEIQIETITHNHYNININSSVLYRNQLVFLNNLIGYIADLLLS